MAQRRTPWPTSQGRRVQQMVSGRNLERHQQCKHLRHCDLDRNPRRREEGECWIMKTEGSWKHRALVVGIRWWSALVLVVCPGAMALGQVLFGSGFGNTNSAERINLKDAWITNNTGVQVYDLHIVSHSAKPNPPNIQGGVIRNTKFEGFQLKNNTPTSFEVRLMGTNQNNPTYVPDGDRVQVTVTAYYGPNEKADTSFYYTWWWSDIRGDPINPPQPLPAGWQGGGRVPIPEPETWAMLAGLGLAGFAVGRRVHAQRARRGSPSESP